MKILYLVDIDSFANETNHHKRQDTYSHFFNPKARRDELVENHLVYLRRMSVALVYEDLQTAMNELKDADYPDYRVKQGKPAVPFYTIEVNDDVNYLTAEEVGWRARDVPEEVHTGKYISPKDILSIKKIEYSCGYKNGTPMQPGAIDAEEQLPTSSCVIQ